MVSNGDSQVFSYDELSIKQEPVGAQIEQDTIENKESNKLDELGEKIFLDRYALKDMTKSSLTTGDTVIVCVDLDTRRREIGKVKDISDSVVTVELRDGAAVKCTLEHVDKPIELKPEQMMDRVARGIAAIEGEKSDEWFKNFRWMMNDWKFVPAGRILTAAGTDQQLTYYNCFVLPSPDDSREGIVNTLSQMMEIMSRGGGVGINLSSLRPRHCYVKGVNGRSSGAVSWGGLFSFTTGLIEQGGSRRGALILVLNDWHPDLMEFIKSKREMGQITNANISVAISDDFMNAVKLDADWNLEFPDVATEDYDEVWEGDLKRWKNLGKPVVVYKTLKARQIWDTIIESAWASGEPGVWFTDRANQMSNSYYFNSLSCVNPCGEEPLPAWSVCDLGAINLSKFVVNGDVDWETLSRVIRYAVRFLDNVIEATPYFFEENREMQLSERRIGLNTMGLAEMLIRLGIRYGSKKSLEFIDKLYKFITTEAYLASVDLAVEKGAFPKFDAKHFLQSGYMLKMPTQVRKAVEEKGIRNVTLLTQAPNGCVTPDTLVFADGALKPIAILGDHDGPRWQNVSFTTHSDSGPRLVKKFYVNGYHEVVEITTGRGFKLAATLQHRVRVIDGEGNYEWRQMGELQPGDTVVMARGGLGKAEAPKLSAVSLKKQRSTLQLPEMMTPELAELLGFYIGDGYLKERRGLGIAVDSRDSDIVGRLKEVIAQTFNLDAHVEDTGRNCLTVWAGSYFIPRWMRANGLAKSSALDAQIPEPVLAGGATTVASFLRGLFESDGSISKGIVTFVTASEQLAREVQIALLGLEIVSTRRSIEPSEGRYGISTRHEVRLLNSCEVLQFR
ncbi:MAG: adenosylcobalamin-dependent ribonucleoside-diphosphate reductase, partial [Candidatus Poribacteria bacterium]